MPDEDAPVASITVERATELSDLSRRPDPARSFRIEFSQLLQFEILLFRQKLDDHGRRHANGAVLRLVFFPRLQRLRVVAETGAATGRCAEQSKKMYSPVFMS